MNRISQYLLCGFCLCFTLPKGIGQDTFEQNLVMEKRSSVFAVPFVFYMPETRWGFGTAGVYTFRLKESALDSRPSKIQLGLAYTQNKQVLFYLPYQFFTQEERFNIYGELGYYLFSYKYFGIGNDTKESDEEIYDVNYPRFRINALKKIKTNFYVGMRYWLDDYNIVETKEEGALSKEEIPGNDSSFLSGIGLVLNYDNRNNLFFPNKGYYIESVFFANTNYLGSDFDFTKFYLDVRTYKTVKQSVFAFNYLAEFTGGIAPFNQLAYIGGSYKMRGIFEGRFKDKQMMVFQGEYRFPLWWRLKAVLFASYGMVAENIGDFQAKDFKGSYGLGFRVLVNKKEDIHLRFDAGFGKGTSGYYVTIGEAF